MASESELMIEALAQKKLNPWHEAAELIETHISKVLIFSSCVLKFKKELLLPFVDYSTREQRLLQCRSEFKLGRLFGGAIYRRVVHVFKEKASNQVYSLREVTADEACLNFGEYAVEMERISNNDLLNSQLKLAPLSDVAIEGVVEHYRKCCHQLQKSSLTGIQYAERVLAHLEDNAGTIREILKALTLDVNGLGEMLGALYWGWVRLRRVLEKRADQGFVILGHGDLRPEHVVLQNHGGNLKVAFMDAVEFSQDFRTLDILDELAFLAMECRVMGREETEKALLQKSAQMLGFTKDNFPMDLCRFYEAYRATVRAKVHLIRAQQLYKSQKGSYREESQKGLRYLDCARDLIQDSAIAKPVAILVAGLMGSGKSTLARALAGQLGFSLLQTDAIRLKFFPPEPNVPFGKGKYDERSRTLVYQTLAQEALLCIQENRSVVLDASFSQPVFVTLVTEVLKKQKVDYFVLEVVVSDEVALSRIAKRLKTAVDPSEGRPDLYFAQKQKGCWDFSHHPHLKVRGENPTQHTLKAVLKSLSDLKIGPNSPLGL